MKQPESTKQLKLNNSHSLNSINLNLASENKQKRVSEFSLYINNEDIISIHPKRLNTARQSPHKLKVTNSDSQCAELSINKEPESKDNFIINNTGTTDLNNQIVINSNGIDVNNQSRNNNEEPNTIELLDLNERIKIVQDNNVLDNIQIDINNKDNKDENLNLLLFDYLNQLY